MKTHIYSNTTDVFGKLLEHIATSAFAYMRFCWQETLSHGSANLCRIGRPPVFINKALLEDDHAISFMYCPRLRHASKLEVTKQDHLLALLGKWLYSTDSSCRGIHKVPTYLPMSSCDFRLLGMNENHPQQVLGLSLQFYITLRPPPSSCNSQVHTHLHNKLEVFFKVKSYSYYIYHVPIFFSFQNEVFDCCAPKLESIRLNQNMQDAGETWISDEQYTLFQYECVLNRTGHCTLLFSSPLTIPRNKGN